MVHGHVVAMTLTSQHMMLQRCDDACECSFTHRTMSTSSMLTQLSVVHSIWSSQEPLLLGQVHSWVQRWPSSWCICQLCYDQYGHRHWQLHQRTIWSPGACRPAVFHWPDQQVPCSAKCTFLPGHVGQICRCVMLCLFCSTCNRR